MSVSLMLLADQEGKIGLDLTRIRDCVRNLPGVVNFRDQFDQFEWKFPPYFICDYHQGNFITTIVAPKSNLVFLSIERTWDVCLQAALDIHKCYKDPIYIVAGDDPGNMIDLSTVSAVDELRERLFT